MRRKTKSGDRYIRAAVRFKSFIATLPASQLSWPDGHAPFAVSPENIDGGTIPVLIPVLWAAMIVCGLARQSWLTLRQAL
ncbi:hypothetical protein [Bradyrhizobium sp. CCGE-LA001]|uniref:hypothetical protein n=1 Tax=Bradyrhizobium sp. CCGE-LA001 TaxID=1223566 RepID=UPI00119820B3|nr:hypothetical protein [Bradyrhizobium sp. CCGE-LA001]